MRMGLWRSMNKAELSPAQAGVGREGWVDGSIDERAAIIEWLCCRWSAEDRSFLNAAKSIANQPNRVLPR